MKRRTRTILFSIFTLLFFLISFLIIFYSQGYRFDFENKKITKTGGLFLKIFPKQVRVYLNDKLIKITDFIFGSVFTENLLPKKYTVRVEKEGYFSWEKSFEIKEGDVIEAKEIILFPESLTFEIFLKEVKNFWVSGDGKKIIIYETEKDGWSLENYDLEKNVKIHLINEKEISEKGTNLINLDFSEDSKEINLEIGIENDLKNFSLLIDQTPSVLKKIEKLPSEIITLQRIGNDVYYLDRFGFLFKTDPLFRGQIKLNREPFPLKTEAKYKLMVFGDWIFLKAGDGLYFLDSESSSFEKLFEEISDLKISPDNKKLTIFSKSEIWLVFLKEEASQPRKKAGDKVFLTRLSEKIGDVFWLNSNYLIFNSGNKIKISEIDDRDRINIYDFGDFEMPKIFFNQANKTFYFLSNDNLFLSKIPII